MAENVVSLFSMVFLIFAHSGFGYFLGSGGASPHLVEGRLTKAVAEVCRATDDVIHNTVHIQNTLAQSLPK